jgi:hypothetical protein
MTAPTPEHLRALSYDLKAAGLRQSSATIRAAADELDRLGAELDSTRQRAGDLYDTCLAQVDVTTRLRATIQNAPHDKDRCNAWWPEYTRPCTCWKAEAL